MAGGAALFCNNGRWRCINLFLKKNLLSSFKSFQLPPPVSLCMKEREKKSEKKKKN